METLRTDLFEEEVFVFTPKGEVKSLALGATPLDFAYEIHTEVGHRCVGASVNGKIVPLHYELRSGDIVEILTAKRERGPSRDWLALVKTTRARNKIKAWFKAESRQDTEHTGRELLQEQLRKQGLPAQKITGSALLADVIREIGFRKADDFYIALGAAKISPKLVVNKVMQRLKQGEAADGEPTAAGDLLQVGRSRRRPTKTSGQYGINVEGVDDVMLRLAKCCRPVPGDEIVGYISLGRGITIHRGDCSNAAVLGRNPERFVNVCWEGETSTGFVVEIQIDALGSPPPAGGHVAGLLGVRRQHRRGALPVDAPDGQEPFRGGGRRQPLAEGRHHAPAQHRLGVRRLPGHARRRPGPGCIGRARYGRARAGLADDVQRVGQDRVARFGHLAEEVPVGLQRQRAPVGGTHGQLPQLPQGGDLAVAAHTGTGENARQAIDSIDSTPARCRTPPASSPESSRLSSAMSIGRSWK